MTQDRDDEVQREIRTHLELEAEEGVANGLSEEEARHAARRAFGNVARTHEDVRAVWSHPWLENALQDARYAVRGLWRSRGFTAVAVLTLALGIGANTAIFSVVNGIVLKPLGYPRPGQLMFLTTRVQGFDQFWVSAPEYFELTEISRSFSVIGAFRTDEANLAALDRPRRIRTAEVDVELLEALDVPPLLGRWFRRDDARPNVPAPVLLSHELWRSAFAAREDLVGQTIDVNGTRREVVGVMPAGFDVLDNGIDLWFPLALERANREEWNRGTHIIYLVGRLKDGVSVTEARRELESLNASWANRTGVKSAHVFPAAGHTLQMEPLQDEIVGAAGRAVWALQAAVGFILLIACANLANLLLTRAEARRPELAVRTALGAGRARLLAQFTIEGLVLSASGAIVGVALAWLGLRGLLELYPDSLPRATDIALDASVLGFTVAVAVAAGVMFGLAPLRHVPRNGMLPSLSGGSRGATAQGRSVRRALVAAEVAFAVLLVTGAGLMLRTVANLLDVDAGFDRSRLVTFGVGLPRPTYPTFEPRRRLYERLLERLEATPGVDGVAAMSGLPPQRQFNGVGTDVEGYTPVDRPVPIVDYYQTVTAAYFDVMRTPIVRGRAFEPGDAAGAPVAVVNERFARTFWPGLDPVGRRIRSHFGGLSPWITVVGVAEDVKQGGLDQQTGTEVYFLFDQIPRIFPPWFLGEWSSEGMHVVARTALPAGTLQPSIATAVSDADPSLPVSQVRAMDEVVRVSVSRPRLLMHLFGGFAGLALLLAGVGTYGVLSYVVTQRRREIGVRMALGAGRDVVIRTIMGHALTPTIVGLAAGLAGALMLTRLMSTLLFGVQPHDPATLAGGAVVMILVASLASLLPAHRATRVNPVVALKEE